MTVHDGRVPGHRPPLHRLDDDRRLVVRVPRAARGRGDQGRRRATRCSSPTDPTSSRAWVACSAPAAFTRATRGSRARGSSSRRTALPLVGSYAMARAPAHARVRHDVRAARGDRGRCARVRRLQPARHATATRSRSTTCSTRGWSPTRCTSSTAASITDGGGAFIMTTEERAKDLAQPPVYVLGAAGTQTHWNIIQMPDFTDVGAATARARSARVGPASPSTTSTCCSSTTASRSPC